MPATPNSRSARRLVTPFSETQDGLERFSAPHFQEAFRLLGEAHQYATEAACDEWQFALERSALLRIGLSLNDMRWLLWKSLISHAMETTNPTEDFRRFQPAGRQILTKRSCFVLTPKGAELIRELANLRETPVNSESEAIPAPLAEMREIPKWDCDLREVRFRGLIVKQFRVPSPNQEMVITAFDEDGWPRRVDDPLPQEAEIDPKQRLHDTIRSLNRNQRHNLIQFKGDGTGEGILWEPIDPTQPSNGDTSAEEP